MIAVIAAEPTDQPAQRPAELSVLEVLTEEEEPCWVMLHDATLGLNKAEMHSELWCDDVYTASEWERTLLCFQI